MHIIHVYTRKTKTYAYSKKLRKGSNSFRYHIVLNTDVNLTVYCDVIHRH